MASVQEKKGFTKAEVISLIGCIIFGVLSYVGFSFNNSPLMAGIFTVLVLGFAFFCLIGLKRIKAAETRRSLWMTVEFALLAGLLAAFMLFFNNGMYKAITVTLQGKTLLQSAAERDIEAIRNQFTTYENDQAAAIEKTCNSLQAVTRLGESSFEDEARFYMQCFFGTCTIQDADIAKFKKNLNMRFLSLNADGQETEFIQENDYKSFKNSVESSLSQIESAVSSWSILLVPQISASAGALSIQQLCEDVPETLTFLSDLKHDQGYPLKFTFVKSGPNASKWAVGEALENYYPAMQSQLAAELNGPTPWTCYLWGFIVNVLMAFTYIMGYRSTKVVAKRSRKGNSDVIGGGRL